MFKQSWRLLLHKNTGTTKIACIFTFYDSFSSLKKKNLSQEGLYLNLVRIADNDVIVCIYVKL